MTAIQNSSPYNSSGNAVDPDKIPKKILYTDAEIPVLGLGTFGSDHYSGEQVAEAVRVLFLLDIDILIVLPFMVMST